MLPEERAAKSLSIRQKLAALLDWSKVENLHCFEPIESLGEVDALSIFTDPSKSHVTIKNIHMDKKLDGRWQTVSLQGNPAIPAKYDVIIVPMLGFDKNLHRIGYGGGFYDKFLASQPQAKRIGVCFESGKVDNIPAQSHDIQLDTIVTDSAVY